MSRAQEKKERDINPYRRRVDFQVRDKVWVSTKNWKTQRPSKKLDHQMDGPYDIVRQVGHSYEVKLPNSTRIHPVFSPDRLRKAAQDPLPGQRNKPSEPIQISDDDEWEIDEILAVKKTRNMLFYRVKWVAQDEDPEWYPAGNLKYAPHRVRDFHLEHRELPGPPKRLREWVKRWEQGDESYENLEDSTEKPARLRASIFQRRG